MAKKMDRKDFLYVLAAPVFGMIGVSFLSKKGLTQELNKRHTAGSSIDIDSAARVGKAYIEQNNSDLGEIRNVAKKLQKATHITGKNLEINHKLINSKIRCDFEQGRTVLFNNWVLSQTEIAFCVLAYDFKSHVS